MIIFISFIMSSIILTSEQVFVSCEGNFYQGNGSLWTLSDGDVYEYEGNPIGEVAQSMLVHDNRLYVIVNVSSNIQVFDITDEGIIPVHLIDTQFSGPREMVIYGNNLYFSNWYTADIKILNLNTLQIDHEIDMPGLPEDIVVHNDKLYISITMNYDWSDGDTVVVLDPQNNQIIEEYDVGPGPGSLAVNESEIFVARTYYDSNWNAFYGTSKIKENNEVVIVSYGAGMACGGSVHSIEGNVYRGYEGGIAKIDEDLNIIESTKIGDFDFNEVYSVEVLNDLVYFGLTDFVAPDQVLVYSLDGQEVSQYEVGALPGDFVIWNSCINNGDLNSDSLLNVSDIVAVVYLVLDEGEYNCKADVNDDGEVNVLDVVEMVQDILGIDSFIGAVNWLKRHIPELQVNQRIKALFESDKIILK